MYPTTYAEMTTEQKKDFWRANPLEGPIAIEIEGLPPFRMANRNDDTVVKELYWTNFAGWEHTSLRLWSRLAGIVHGGVILDVGSYTGIYALVAALQAPAAKVCALDIQQRCVDRVLENADLNGLTIEAEAVAASNDSGEATFYFNDAPDIISSVASLSPGRYATQPSGVAQVRLDEWLQIAGCQAESVRLVKIDVEGSERKVLEGMSGILTAAQPDVVIEILNRKHVEEIWAMFPAGYHCLQIDDTKNGAIRPVRKFRRRTGRNYLLTTEPTEALRFA